MEPNEQHRLHERVTKVETLQREADVLLREQIGEIDKLAERLRINIYSVEAEILGGAINDLATRWKRLFDSLATIQK